MKNKLPELLGRHKFIYILTHTLPDGDAIGSTLAWGITLRHGGKEVRMFCPGIIPEKYSFLPGAAKIEREFPVNPPPGLVFVLDCGDLDRLDYMQERIKGAGKIVNIDHHATNTFFGDYNIIDSSASATGEIIYQLICALDLLLDRAISLCLYVAIASDTGSFKHENVTPQTLRIASELLEKGVNPAQVSRKIFDEYPLSTMYLLHDALATLQLDDTSRIAWMYLHEDVLGIYGAKSAQLEGFINYGKNIKGVEVGVFFHHMRNRETKVGFRSKTVDVSAIAGQFGGGGHPRAAGCTIRGQEEAAAREMILRAVRAALPEKKPVEAAKSEPR